MSFLRRFGGDGGMGAGMAAAMADRPAEKKAIVRKAVVVPPLHAAVKAGNEVEVARLLAVRRALIMQSYRQIFRE